MMGIKCKVPNTAFQAAALDQHLLTIGAGDNVVRLLPPLVVTDADIAEAVDKLDRACRALEAKARPEDLTMTSLRSTFSIFPISTRQR